MRRKCRALGGIAVMELVDIGEQTRAMSATGTVHKKRRRLNKDEEAEYNKVTSSTNSITSYIQLRSRRIFVDHHRREGNRCLRANSDHDDEVSCFSCNIGSSDKSINVELPDLEDESIEVETSTHFSSSESMRETTAFSDLRAEPEDLDSTSRSSETNFRRRSTVEKMPTEAELEEFFAPAEKKLQKQFAEKYNYDIVKDEPLEGRYEWVRLKP
ncbi:Cyclin-dependent kinase inhibitor family protein, putative isoform 2 [Hibiscus syriacus]|uniref:Cyclin-dependent kinase inhibitor n=1 Tax=Hibiscus syriacus TaxID=106335 RepID=A0A6A3AJM8_HIBSY|nr:cyclin-dependent kinase inhibitor 7-like [Hibiscus syriacus]KAE8704801.1 Cyclin-dependent kinase inhibitor family protein, putative isoform 2 [Hibiscus syriacus]